MESEKAVIILLVFLLAASGLGVLAQRSHISELEKKYSTLTEDYSNVKTKYDTLYSDYRQLNDSLFSNYRLNSQLGAEIEELETSLDYTKKTLSSYQEKYEEMQIENAKLKVAMMLKGYSDSLTYPKIKPHKDPYRIGYAIVFDINSTIPLYGSNFTIKDPSGNIAWEGDTLNTWSLVNDRFWVAPFYTQTSNGNPIVLEEDMPLGNWTWTYRLGDVIEIKGAFTVEEALKWEGGGIVSLSQLSDLAKQLALDCFHETLMDPSYLNVTKVANESAEYPVGSGEIVEVLRVNIEGTGILASSGETVNINVVYYMLIDQREIVEISRVVNPV